MKQPLNRNEEKVLEAILEFFKENKKMPTRVQLATKLTNETQIVSPQLLQYWLRLMEKKGWLVLIPFRRRNISLK